MQTTSATHTPELTMYYDGQCPLCVAEVEFLQSRNAQGQLAFVDVTQTGFEAAGHNIYLSRPVQPSTVIITSPPVVVMSNPQPTQWVNGQPVQQPVEAYYCRDSGQYFPVVQTCPTPWMVVMR